MDTRDIAEKLRLKQVVDQSSVTIPPFEGTGDLPTIFNNIQSPKNSKSFTKITTREAGLLSLLSAMSRTQYWTTLNEFVTFFLEDFNSYKASVDGFRSKQIANICGGNVNYERKLEFARIKSKNKEDFV